MAISIKKLLQSHQMSAVTAVALHRANAFTTRHCSHVSLKTYNTPRGAVSHNFADTTYYEHDVLLRKIPKFQDLDLKQVNKLFHSLKTFEYTWDDIMKTPKVVLMPPYNIFYSMDLLKEFGFNNPKLHDVIYCKAMMNSEISYLRFYGYISEDTNVLQHLWKDIKQLELDQTVFEEAEQRYPETETTTVGELHIHFLKYYLSQRFSVEVEKVEFFLIKAMNKKGRQAGSRKSVTYKGLCRYPAICDILLYNLQYDFNHVSMHSSLFNIYPESVERLLTEFPTIGGSSIYDIALKYPDILLIPVENIKHWVTLLEKYKVTHFIVTKATLKLFLTGNYNEVEERLHALSLHIEFKMICYSDKLFNILLQPYGVKRLVDVFSSGQPLKSVNSIVKKGSKVKWFSKTPGELVNFIAQELDLEKKEAKEILASRKFVHFGLANSILLINLLKEYGFSKEQIKNGIDILCFEYSSVNNYLKGFSKILEAQFNEWMKNPFVIHLLMYLIKKNGVYS